MTLYTYPITVEREGVQYYAYSEDFPGVYGLGKTIEEAKKSIVKAMHLYTGHCRKAHRQDLIPQMPKPRADDEA